LRKFPQALLLEVTRDTDIATKAKNQVALETEDVERQADTVRVIQVCAFPNVPLYM